MTNVSSININTSLWFNNGYYFYAELLNMIIKKMNLPIREVWQLSSRESAKSWHTETLAALAIIQQYTRTSVHWIRARNADTEKAQDTIRALISEYQGDNNVLSNKQTKRIKIGFNEINFVTLNEQKEKVHKSGGKVGVAVPRRTEYIIAIFEEASQLDQDLVENYRQSLRANKNTKLICFYNSNPWNKAQWFVDKFVKNLPETKDMEEELLTRGYNFKFDSFNKILYFRPRYTINPHVAPGNIADIEGLKEINYAKWQIVSLGFSGNLNGSLYAASLPKLQTARQPYYGQQFFGGVDWGDGKSKQGSPSVCYFGGISLSGGIDIYAEQEWWNNKGVVLSTEAQINMICDFYIDRYQEIKRPITVFVDNASLNDFFVMFQTILANKGYGPNQIEFFPSLKLKNTWERVESVNAYISLGILRYNKEVCKGLYRAMENCYEVIQTNPKEGQKRDRSHEWTHWLHALEYLLNTYLKEFQSQLPKYVIDDKTLNMYGVY